MASEENGGIIAKLPSQHISLSPVQVDVITKAFTAVANRDSGEINVDQAESLVLQLFQHPLTEDLLDTIIAVTEGASSVSLQEFLGLVAYLLTRTTYWGKLKTATAGRVGFDTVGEQQLRKTLKRGFDFNVIVIGESGLGKSTLVDTLFQGNFSRQTLTSETVYHVPEKTVEIHTVTHVVDEGGVRVRLSITDTPGFGDQIDNSDCWSTVESHIVNQFQLYYNQESALHRPANITDTRIHCCLYFIAPTGHSLKALDIECMRNISRHVAVIPIIAKADILTLQERAEFKQRIREDLDHAGIALFPFPRDDDEKEDTNLNDKIRDLMPFAVVGSNGIKTVDSKPVRGRQTKFGFVEVENPNHCDFGALRDMLIRTHLQDLREVTIHTKYEEFRRSRMVRDTSA